MNPRHPVLGWRPEYIRSAYSNSLNPRGDGVIRLVEWRVYKSTCICIWYCIPWGILLYSWP